MSIFAERIERLREFDKPLEVLFKEHLCGFDFPSFFVVEAKVTSSPTFGPGRENWSVPGCDVCYGFTPVDMLGGVVLFRVNDIMPTDDEFWLCLDCLVTRLALFTVFPDLFVGLRHGYDNIRRIL